MEQRTLEINVISARDLKDVNLFSKMDVYVAVWLSGDSQIKQKAKTKVDRNSGTSPSWNNFPMKFTVDESAAKQNRLILVFKLRCKSSLGSGKDVGEVQVPVKELLKFEGDGKSMQFVSYQVKKPSGKPKGELNFSYKFTGRLAYPIEPSAPPYPPSPLGGYSYATTPPIAVNGEAHHQEPAVTAYAYPVQPSAPPYLSPTPVRYAYATPVLQPPSYQQHGGYPYPPPPPGYGYPPPSRYLYPPVQQPRKKSGTRLEAGVLGAIGGVLLKVTLLACFQSSMLL